DGKTFAFNDIVPGTFGESRIRFVDVASGSVVRTIKGGFTAAYAMAFSDDGKRIAAGYGDRVTRVWSVDTGALLTSRPLEGHTQYVRATAFSRDGKYLLTGSEDGTLRLHRLDNAAAVSLIARGEDWLVYSDDGYFDASRRGGSLVAATSGLRPFRVDQLAVRNNRPDILLARMGLGTPALIEHYRLRYERRLKKLNMKGGPASASFEKAPEAKIVELVEKGGAAEVTFDIEGIGADLLRYNVFVNDVPLFGALGKETSGKQRRITERVELSAGRNKIEVSALDEGGSESLRAFRVVTGESKEPGDLYYLGFGVSKYKNPKYNLGYPHKDILDVGEVLKSAKGTFRNVRVSTFVNEQVTVDAVRRAKAALSGAGVNDTVVLFVAGHGLHTPAPAADYYFATHEVDVKRLPETAASFELIEDLLQGIAPRKKLFLMDTCESGEAADESEMTGAGMQALGGAAGRGLRARTTRALSLDVTVEAKEPAPMRAHLFDRDRYVYNDLSRRSGAIVLSSSRGSELSYELDELQNGVFSEAILIALTTDRADVDKDGHVSVDELRAFVAGEVPKRTWDKQHPTVDRDNLDVQFGFPVVKEAASIVTRADPTTGESRSRDIETTGAEATEPAPSGPPKTQVPPGCGCELPQKNQKSKGNLAASLAGLAAFAAAWRRRRASRA
ncbi:MAG TPA: caspase family protein, partial [Polyangiaceae bacterium]|nr:caspase family protein [Polyangiaceae bacterium]